MATKKTPIYEVNIERVTRNYPIILRRCAEKLPRQRGDLTIFDVVHDTVLRIIHDHRATQMATDRDFVDYFMFRTNAVIFKETHDMKSMRKAYANYLKAQAEVASDE